MLNSKKMVRIVVSCVLLVAIVATCVGVYNMGNSNTTKEQNLAEKEQDDAKEELAANDDQELQEDTQNVDTNSVEGTKEIEEQAQQPADQTAQEDQNTQDNGSGQQDAAQDTSAAAENVQPEAAPEVNFTESSLMEWPLNGEVVLDYSMDRTIYFPTLNEYKCNPSIVISSDVNAPVLAAANGTVASITSNEETGTTLTMDMGNGYQAVYGQLKEVPYEEGDTVASGSIIGYISEPTKYYSVEGSNLYFQMSKDGNPIDPMMYLP